MTARFLQQPAWRELKLPARIGRNKCIGSRPVLWGTSLVSSATRMPWWAWLWPVLATATMNLTLFAGAAGVIGAAAGLVLIATVFAAVYHAEVVAHRIGEPFGTLVLAVAVTVIEVALIVSVMIA